MRLWEGTLAVLREATTDGRKLLESTADNVLPTARPLTLVQPGHVPFESVVGWVTRVELVGSRLHGAGVIDMEHVERVALNLATRLELGKSLGAQIAITDYTVIPGGVTAVGGPWVIKYVALSAQEPVWPEATARLAR